LGAAWDGAVPLSLAQSAAVQDMLELSSILAHGLGRGNLSFGLRLHLWEHAGDPVGVYRVRDNSRNWVGRARWRIPGEGARSVAAVLRAARSLSLPGIQAGYVTPRGLCVHLACPETRRAVRIVTAADVDPRDGSVSESVRLEQAWAQGVGWEVEYVNERRVPLKRGGNPNAQPKDDDRGQDGDDSDAAVREFVRGLAARLSSREMPALPRETEGAGGKARGAGAATGGASPGRDRRGMTSTRPLAVDQARPRGRMRQTAGAGGGGAE
jgi:hypothetical protein